MRVRIFKDPVKYEELVQLLNAKASYKSISRHFHCDHTSIIYWARKIGIPVVEKHIEIIIPLSFRVPLEDHEHPVLKADKMNCGKSYASYKRDERERKIKHFTLPNGLVL